MVNRIILNETSYHGAGAIGSIVAELASRGLKKPIVFSDPDLIKFGVTKKVTDLLDKAKVKYAVYSEIKPNPTIQNVKNGVKAAKAAKADCIVAIGGGSSMDTAKGVGIIITNPKFSDVRELRVRQDDADALRRVHRAAAADRDDAVGLRRLRRLHAVLHVRDRRIRLDLRVDRVLHLRLVEEVRHLLRHAELDEIRIGEDDRLLEPARGELGDDGLHGARAVIRGFVEDDSVDHGLIV